MTNIRREQRELSKKLRKKVFGKNASREVRKAAHAYLYRQMKGMAWTSDSMVYGVGFRTFEDYSKSCKETK